ncbi:MAG: hypothetical protein VZQ96_06890 [Succiniclasticum sp.]|nr:hypothetical protein [Succiniclasticum sp.]
MNTDSPDFMQQLRFHTERMRDLCEVAICAAPQTVQQLKDRMTAETGKAPEPPFYLFGCVVFDFPCIPENQVLVVDREKAQRLHDQRIPFSGW